MQESRPRVLIVDHDPRLNAESDSHLRSAGAGVTPLPGQADDMIIVRVAAGCREIPQLLDHIRRGWHQYPRWSLVLISQGGPARKRNSSAKGPGQLLAEAIWARSEFEGLPVVMVVDDAAFSGMPSADLAHPRVTAYVERSLVNHETLRELLFNDGLIEDSATGLIGRSIPFLKLLQEVRLRVKQEKGGNILLYGETGTGKELLARYVHLHSGREGHFIPFAAQTIPEELITSELFGYKKGAFTGAVADFPGVVMLANGGTLFIDEFGDLSAKAQTALLRFLDPNTREILKIGSGRPVKRLDVQVLMATNKDLTEMRSDLLFRAGAPIFLPTLRERQEDIAVLADFYLKRAVMQWKGRTRKISEDGIELLQAYRWPGNVRQLIQVVTDAVMNNRSHHILTAAHFRPLLAAADKAVQRRKLPGEVFVMAQRPGHPHGSDELAAGNRPAAAPSTATAFPEQMRGRMPNIESDFLEYRTNYIRDALYYYCRNHSRRDKLLPITAMVRWMMNDQRLHPIEARRKLYSWLKHLPDAGVDDPILILARAIANTDKDKRLPNKNPAYSTDVKDRLKRDPDLGTAYQRLQQKIDAGGFPVG